MHYAPHEFRTGGQVDPRRWNENVQALRDREQELLSRRVVRFSLQFDFKDFNYTGVVAGNLYRYKFDLPFDYNIEQMYVAVNSSDTDTYVAALRNDLVTSFTERVEVDGDGAGGLASAAKSLSKQVSANTGLVVDLTCSTSTTYDAGGATVIVYCTTDAFRDVPDLDDLDFIELDNDDDLTAAYANTLFTNHENNMDKLTSAPDSGSTAVKVSTSMVVALEVGGGAIALQQQYHILHPSLSGFFLDDVDFYVEQAPGSSTTVRVQDDGVDVDSAVITNTLAGTFDQGTRLSGLGILDTDGEIAVKFESSGTVNRAYAVVHFTSRF